jgi:hypothetical protein
MENNPIDKLFAEKLQQVEKTPRADVWSKIQARQQEKKSGAFWWTTIAASVLVLLLSGGLSWRYLYSVEEGGNVPREMATQFTGPKVVQPLAATDMMAKQPEKKGTIVKEKVAVKPKIKFKARTKQVPQPELITANPETSPTVIQPSISSEETSVAETKPTVLVMTIAEPSGSMENIPPKSNATPRLNRSEINVTAEKGAPVAVESKKKTRAGKIFQQLKHIKNGEKVEWKEIGIHPENLLALVKLERTTKSNSSK